MCPSWDEILAAPARVPCHSCVEQVVGRLFSSVLFSPSVEPVMLWLRPLIKQRALKTKNPLYTTGPSRGKSCKSHNSDATQSSQSPKTTTKMIKTAPTNRHRQSNGLVFFFLLFFFFILFIFYCFYFQNLTLSVECGITLERRGGYLSSTKT